MARAALLGVAGAAVRAQEPPGLTPEQHADLERYDELAPEERDRLAKALAAVFYVPAPYRLTRLHPVRSGAAAGAPVRVEFGVEGAPALHVRLYGPPVPGAAVQFLGRSERFDRARLGAALGVAHELHAFLAREGFRLESARFQPTHGPIQLDAAISAPGGRSLDRAYQRLHVDEDWRRGPPSIDPDGPKLLRALAMLDQLPRELGLAKRYRVSGLLPQSAQPGRDPPAFDVWITEKGQTLLRMLRHADGRRLAYELEGIPLDVAAAGGVARTVAPVLSEKLDVWQKIHVVQVRCPDGDLLVAAVPRAPEKTLLTSDAVVVGFDLADPGVPRPLATTVTRCAVVTHPNRVSDVFVDVAGTSKGTRTLRLRSGAGRMEVTLDGEPIR